MVDTGSDDLWFLPTAVPRLPHFVNTTDIPLGMVYGDGSNITGVVAFAEVQLGEYTVPSQGEFTLPL